VQNYFFLPVTLIFLITLIGLITSVSFADNVSISIPTGTAVPGCETTNGCFIPVKAMISLGGTVTWTNDDNAAHTVTSGRPVNGANGLFDSSLFMPDTTFSHTFDRLGLYNYYCMVHPWMEGIIHVQEKTSNNLSGYSVQSSYTADCKNRPTGTVCAAFGDGFVWLIKDSVLDWSNKSENGYDIQIAIGSNNKYYHALNTNLVKVEKIQINIDSDKDGITDNNDQCPNQAEDFDGYQDSDGCPESGPVIETKKSNIVIDKQIYESNDNAPINIVVAGEIVGHDRLNQYVEFSIVGPDNNTITSKAISLHSSGSFTGILSLPVNDNTKQGR